MWRNCWVGVELVMQGVLDSGERGELIEVVGDGSEGK